METERQDETAKTERAPSSHPPTGVKEPAVLPGRPPGRKALDSQLSPTNSCKSVPPNHPVYKAALGGGTGKYRPLSDLP